MKCIKCMTEKAEEVEAEYVYHGFSLCDEHFKAWHGLCLKEREDANAKIITPDRRN